MGGKVHHLAQNPEFQRRLLSRINGVGLALGHSHPIVRLKTKGGCLLPLHWLCRQVTFRFIIDGGRKILEAPYRKIFPLNLEAIPPYYIEVGPLRNTATGQFEAGLGEWQTLNVTVVAGGEEKSFEVAKAL